MINKQVTPRPCLNWACPERRESSHDAAFFGSCAGSFETRPSGFGAHLRRKANKGLGGSSTAVSLLQSLPLMWQRRDVHGREHGS